MHIYFPAWLSSENTLICNHYTALDNSNVPPTWCLQRWRATDSCSPAAERTTPASWSAPSAERGESSPMMRLGCSTCWDARTVKWCATVTCHNNFINHSRQSTGALNVGNFFNRLVWLVASTLSLAGEKL